jgi:hypothetical protein
LVLDEAGFAASSFRLFALSLTVLAIAAFIWRVAWALACPRTEAAIRFAALSHMLMNGFFFNQGLDMRDFLLPRTAAMGGAESMHEQRNQDDDRDGNAEKEQQD